MPVLNLKQALRLVVLFALVACAISGFATTVTFDAMPSGFFNPGDTFQTQGYQFNQLGAPGDFGTVSDGATSCGPPCVSNGTQSYHNFNDAYFTMEAVGGSPFSLSQFDAAGTFIPNPRDTPTIEVTGFLNGGGTVVADFNLSSPDMFVTFMLPGTFTDLTSVEFRGIGGGPESNEFTVDNVVANGSAPTPEPASLFLLASGLAACAGTLRRKLIA